jgi:hypothetical protein
MQNESPFSIRKELLELSRDIVQYNVDVLNQQKQWDWTEVESKKGSAAKMPTFNTYTVKDVLDAAKQMQAFVNDRRG